MDIYLQEILCHVCSVHYLSYFCEGSHLCYIDENMFMYFSMSHSLCQGNKEMQCSNH